MPAIDRREGVYQRAAIKLPCRVASTANITLSGLQTVDGVALAADDRVLVKDQTTGTENGIYTADTGAWSRTEDFNGTYDVVTGTLVLITSGTVNGSTVFELTTASPVIGTTSLAFSQTGAAALSLASAYMQASVLPATTADGAAAALSVSYIVADLAALKALAFRPSLVVSLGRGAAGDGAGGHWRWVAGSSTTADDALIVQCTSGTAGRYIRMVFDSTYRLSWWGPDNTGATDCAQKIRDWFTAFTGARTHGHADGGRYRCDTAIALDLGLANGVSREGAKMSGDGMYNTVFDVTNVATSPQWKFYVSGGTPSAPAAANFWGIRDFAISGNIGAGGIAVQWGNDDISDALDSFMVENVWMANSNTAKSATSVGVRYNNTVRCTFDNIVNACGTEQLDKTVSGAVDNGSGKVRLTVNNTTTLVANMVAVVSGIVGTTEANGTQTVLTVVDGTHIDLDVAFSNAYVSGGTVTCYKGYGMAAQMRSAAFCYFGGAFGPAGTGIHLTGVTNYGNTFDSPDIELVNDAILQDVACGPNTFQGGQYAVYGGGYLVSNTAATSTGLLLIDNPNNGTVTTNLYSATGKGVDPLGYYMIEIRGYYGDGPQLISVGASPYTWTNKTGQKQVPIISGGTVSKIEYKGPNSGSAFADTFATAGAMPPVASGAAIKITHAGAPTFFVSPLS